MVVAQAAQRVKEADITEQDSLLLTRNLLRIAIFNISYIRGLFPEKYFNDKSVPALEMKIKKLMPMDAESRRLIDWMEKGVYDALQKKYLKTLLFCICEAVDGPMIEEYAFSFSYSSSDNEEVSMNVSRRGNKKQGATFKSNTTDITPDQMRRSACKMVRTLVQLMRTLDQMPDERVILMKLLYYDDATPEDYEPPFFRSCPENEANNTWMKNPLIMEVGNVNSKHFVLALKVKSILDPCEDENGGLRGDEEVSLGADSEQQDDSSSDSEVDISRENQYIVAPVGGIRNGDDSSMADEDNTQDAELEEENTARLRAWIRSRHTDTVDLSDILTNFPDISVALTEGTEEAESLKMSCQEIVGNLLKEGLISKAGRESYTIKKNLNPGDTVVKEEIDMQDAPHTDKVQNGNVDYMYMKALYYALPMDYVTITKLQNKLEGEANQSTVRKLIDKMVQDGFIKNTGSRKLGKRVVHSELTANKLLEVKKALENKTMPMETNSQPFEFDGMDFASNGVILKDGSTCAGLHSIGSDLTRTRGQSDMHQNGSVRSGQTPLKETREQGNTPTSKPEPIASLESGVGKGKENEIPNDRIPRDADVTVCSRSTQDKRIRKASTVKEPILQYIKRQRSQAE